MLEYHIFVEGATIKEVQRDMYDRGYDTMEWAMIIDSHADFADGVELVCSFTDERYAEDFIYELEQEGFDVIVIDF
tara:strand:- start:46 stop:273 length:228 start_codon:yes stop_codon:yes gene_type:complete